MTAPEPCTTGRFDQRHLSTTLVFSGRGRVGRTLCGEEAYDQRVVDWCARVFDGYRIVIADLPSCGSCATAAAKREGDRDDRT